MISLEDCVIRGEGAGTLCVRMRASGITIVDGHGGSLDLDLSQPDLHWLADACERLAGGELPPNAGVLKVHAAGQVYLLARRTRADQAPEISISSLFGPGERVVLTDDIAHLVTLLIRLARAAHPRGAA